jgi:hypothetical protein
MKPEDVNNQRRSNTCSQNKSKTLHRDVHFQAWCRRSSRKASACWQIRLGWGSAREAARLAPSKEARSLAILEAVISSHGIAVTTSITDSNLSGHAALEFVMINATQTQSLLPTLVALVTKIIVVKSLNGCLIVRCALNCGRSFHAW